MINTGGFTLSALPQYNALDPRLFVADPNRLLEGFQQGFRGVQEMKRMPSETRRVRAQNELGAAQAGAALPDVGVMQDAARQAAMAQQAEDVERARIAKTLADLRAAEAALGTDVATGRRQNVPLQMRAEGSKYEADTAGNVYSRDYDTGRLTQLPERLAMESSVQKARDAQAQLDQERFSRGLTATRAIPIDQVTADALAEFEANRERRQLEIDRLRQPARVDQTPQMRSEWVRPPGAENEVLMMINPITGVATPALQNGAELFRVPSPPSTGATVNLQGWGSNIAPPPPRTSGPPQAAVPAAPVQVQIGDSTATFGNQPRGRVIGGI